MDRYGIEYTDRFKIDLEKVRRYILFTLENPVSAQGIVETILKKCMELSFLPEGTPIRYTLDGVGFRYVHVKNYTIIYSSNREKKLITVHAVMYSRRNIRKVLGES